MENVERLLVVQLGEEGDIVRETGEHDRNVLVGLAEQLSRLSVTEEKSSRNIFLKCYFYTSRGTRRRCAVVECSEGESY